jgi:hypothetical protein
MDNKKDEREIADTEDALRFIGKKYLYVYECDNEVKFFDTYVKIKQGKLCAIQNKNVRHRNARFHSAFEEMQSCSRTRICI